MAQSAIHFSPSTLYNTVVQTAHDFTVGLIVGFNSGTLMYDLSVASSLIDAQCIGMVSYVFDANTFALTQCGYVQNIPITFTPGEMYYLQDAGEGLLGTTPGTYNVPLFIPDTAHSGYYQNFYASIANA